MVRRLSCFIVLIAGIAGMTWAGDVATMVNLGFSRDSETFAFAQYGIREDSLFPYAEIFIVDVAQNRFVKDGVIRNDYERRVEPGYDGSAALYRLLGEQTAAFEKSDIDHTNTGRLVYVLMDGDEPRAELNFRDFQTENEYTVKLVQSRQGEGADVRARFHLDVQVLAESGKQSSFQVGLPQFDRAGMQRYRIHQVLVSPDNQFLVFVIEMEQYAEQGVNVRYMVETAEIK